MGRKFWLLASLIAAPACQDERRPASPYDYVCADPSMNDWNHKLLQIENPAVRYEAYQHCIRREPPPLGLARTLKRDGHVLLPRMLRDLESDDAARSIGARYAITEVAIEHPGEVCRSKQSRDAFGRMMQKEEFFKYEVAELANKCEWDEFFG